MSFGAAPLTGSPGSETSTVSGATVASSRYSDVDADSDEAEAEHEGSTVSARPLQQPVCSDRGAEDPHPGQKPCAKSLAQILGCNIVLPVQGPGFRSRFWAGLGRSLVQTDQNSGLKLAGPKARSFWDRILVRLRKTSGENRPRSLVRRPEA